MPASDKLFPLPSTAHATIHLQVFSLRRTKDQRLNGKPIVMLPTKTIVLKHLRLSTREQVASFKVGSEEGSYSRLIDLCITQL